MRCVGFDEKLHLWCRYELFLLARSFRRGTPLCIYEMYILGKRSHDPFAWCCFRAIVFPFSDFLVKCLVFPEQQSLSFNLVKQGFTLWNQSIGQVLYLTWHFKTGHQFSGQAYFQSEIRAPLHSHQFLKIQRLGNSEFWWCFSSNGFFFGEENTT